jgi:hypothetical protein
MDLDRAHLDLRVVDWVQTISIQGSADSAGPSLRARCSAMDGSYLTLSSGESITQIPIDVALFRGPLTVGDGRPLEKGVGLFNYVRSEEPRTNYVRLAGLRLNFVRSEGVRPPSTIACYIGLEPDFYNEVWAQVRSGTFSESNISLDIDPVQSPGQPVSQVTNRGSLFVLGASFHFIHSRRPPQRIL